MLAQPEPKRRPTAADESKWCKSVSRPRTTAEQTAKAAATTDVVDELLHHRRMLRGNPGRPVAKVTTAADMFRDSQDQRRV